MADKKTTGAAAAKPAAGNKPAGDNKPAGNPPATTTTTTATTSEEQRKRNFLSPQKALAIAIAGLVGILTGEKVAALLSDDQKAQVKAASDMADELNKQTIKPVQDRLLVVQAELAKLAADPKTMIEPANIKKVQEFASEAARLQKRLETFTGAATQTI